MGFEWRSIECLIMLPVIPTFSLIRWTWKPWANLSLSHSFILISFSHSLTLSLSHSLTLSFLILIHIFSFVIQPHLDAKLTKLPHSYGMERDAPEITVDELKQKKDSFVIIDCREESEYKQGHIEGKSLILILILILNQSFIHSLILNLILSFSFSLILSFSHSLIHSITQSLTVSFSHPLFWCLIWIVWDWNVFLRSDVFLIKGAIHVPTGFLLSHSGINDPRILSLKDKNILLYCRSGTRSKMAAEELLRVCFLLLIFAFSVPLSLFVTVVLFHYE
jgi:rhodanese-related sulfurtransferase